MREKILNLLCFKKWCLFLFLIFLAVNVFGEIKETEYRGLKAVQIENDILKVIVLPQRGANIASIVYKPSGRDWLWHNPRPYKIPPYGATFTDYDISGFDDCFPSVGQCPYPDGAWKRIVIPDHGEVWAMPWDYKIIQEKGKRGSKVKFWVHGMRFPYLLEKTISLSKNTIKIAYRVTNYAPEPLKAIWAAHALVAVSSGMQMLFPRGTVIKGDTAAWNFEEKGVMLSGTIGDSSTRIARKLFTEKVPEGWCGFYEPISGDYLMYFYPEDKIPYIGIWITQGGFPEGEWHYNVGLEPTNCGVETVVQGDKEGILVPIPAKGIFEWTLMIAAGRAENIEQVPTK